MGLFCVFQVVFASCLLCFLWACVFDELSVLFFFCCSAGWVCFVFFRSYSLLVCFVFCGRVFLMSYRFFFFFVVPRDGFVLCFSGRIRFLFALFFVGVCF